MTTEISEDVAYGMKLNDEAIKIAGLAKSLSLLSEYTLMEGNFRNALEIEFAYECLGNLALALAEKIDGAVS